MNKRIYRISTLILALAMILGNIIPAQAAGATYYVSPTGSDTNPGTASAPFKTFAKANSMLAAGGTLYIYAGVYNQQLKITKSGTSSAWINVKPTGGAVVIDMANIAEAGMDIRASYVNVSGLQIKNANYVCVNLLGSNITVDGIVVTGCSNHGIQANNSSTIKILNSEITRTVLSNAARTLASGWGSAIKVRVSDNVLIQGNHIAYNYGEGIGSRGTNITIRGNTIHDNYSVNIYTNSENTLIERNFVYCQPNTGYERNGLPASGINLAEEYFEGWGARLKNAKVINNIVAFCRNGIRYNGADDLVTGGGLKNSTIAYNTLYATTNAALSIVYESAQSGNLIANNIIWQAQNNLTSIDSLVGLTFQNNLWKAAPPAGLNGPGDKVGEPQFATTPGYTPESYRPGSASPAAKAAADIGITTDFYSKPRGPSFDMGAIQFSSASSPAPTVPPTLTVLPPTAAPTKIATATALPPTAAPTRVVTATAIPPTVAATNPPPQASPTSLPSSQETTYDNKHTSFVYSAGWAEESSGSAIDGSFARTSTNGSSVSFVFTGQSFSLIYKGGPSYRAMEVYLDGALVGTIDQRRDVSTYKLRWDYPGQLPAGQHTLKLVFIATSSTNNGSVDAVIVR